VGTPLPENEPGNPCGVCFGVGKAFPLPTPKYVQLDFSGVKPGQNFNGLQGGLPNGSHILKQYTPCSWTLFTANESYFLMWSINRSTVSSQDRSTQFTFQTVFLPALCMVEFDNAFTVWNGSAAFGGTCKVIWNI